MTSIARSALVAHPAERLFALVADIPRYPQFLPWCRGAVVEAREGAIVQATIEIDFLGMRQSFTTRNAERPPVSAPTAEGARLGGIDMTLVRGPFRTLAGVWEFAPLTPTDSRVALSLDYEFANGFLERIAGPAFAKIADTLVESFIQEADRIASDRR